MIRKEEKEMNTKKSRLLKHCSLEKVELERSGKLVESEW